MEETKGNEHNTGEEEKKIEFSFIYRCLPLSEYIW